MKRKVLVTIDCGDKTCDQSGRSKLCDWLWYGTCALFDRELKQDKQCEHDYRCRACLLAESKAKGGK